MLHPQVFLTVSYLQSMILPDLIRQMNNPLLKDYGHLNTVG